MGGRLRQSPPDRRAQGPVTRRRFFSAGPHMDVRRSAKQTLLQSFNSMKRRSDGVQRIHMEGLAFKRALRPRRYSSDASRIAASSKSQSSLSDGKEDSETDLDDDCSDASMIDGYLAAPSGRIRRTTSEDPGIVVIEPSGPHTHTAILLHGMYCSPESSDTFVGLPAAVKSLGLLPGIKYVFPHAPRRTISWPTGPEANVASWYNYYTRRDGELEHDVLNEAHLASQTRRIHSIVEREAALLGGDARRIMLGGSSQGGTVALHATINYHRPLGALLCLRSCLIDSVTFPRDKRSPAAGTPVFVFAAAQDKVYAPQLQYRGFSLLADSGFHVEWHVEPHLTHWDESRTEKRVVAAWIARTVRERGLRERERSVSPELILEPLF
uniref:TeCe n=1 Tax=Isochrysis galbana TaxID=37099 RepID=U5U2U1_ISOGA|nr:TeCe [Isochrysis galbana]